MTIEAAPFASTALGRLPRTLPSLTIARKNAASSLGDRLIPRRTTGAVKLPDTTISSATDAPMLNPTTTHGLTAAYGVELRRGSSFAVRFVDGRYGLEPSGSAPVDCTISADPVAYLLVAAGRMSQWEAIALGLIAAEGPKPELALGFVDLFMYP